VDEEEEGDEDGEGEGESVGVEWRPRLRADGGLLNVGTGVAADGIGQT